MKAQSQILSHTLITALSLFLIISIVSTVDYVKTRHQEIIEVQESRYTCTIVKRAIDKIYQPSTKGNNTLMGSVSLDLPPHINTVFVNNTLHIFHQHQNYTCPMTYNISYIGLAKGRTTIKWYSDHNERIEMVKT